MEVRVGTSGWIYPHWRGRFYPRDLPARAWLAYAAARLDALEINATFYRSAHPSTFTRWRQEIGGRAAEGFRFAVKGSRYITHMLKLAKAETPLANFFASGPLLLGDALGPILWQLPPQLGFDEARLARFVDLLPRTVGAAQRLAARHDARFADRATTDRGPGLAARARLAYAIEPRHPSWDCPAFFRLCARRDIAVVEADTAGKHVALAAPLAPLVYVRLHGARKLYASRYTDAELDAWTVRAAAWRKAGVREAYVFFDNDYLAHAAHDALRLIERLR